MLQRSEWFAYLPLWLSDHDNFRPDQPALTAIAKRKSWIWMVRLQHSPRGAETLERMLESKDHEQNMVVGGALDFNFRFVKSAPLATLRRAGYDYLTPGYVGFARGHAQPLSLIRLS
jgi:hypothetical protein